MSILICFSLVNLTNLKILLIYIIILEFYSVKTFIKYQIT